MSSGYLNIDPSDIVPEGNTDSRFDLRYFGGHENLLYGSLGHRWGIGAGREGTVRLVLSSEKSTPAGLGGTIRFGGVDFEAGVRAQLGQSGVVGFVGISAPQTRAERAPVLSMSLAASRELGKGLSVAVNPRAVSIHNNAIVGVGIGAKTTQQGRVSISAEFTPILAGDNTRDVMTGDRIRRHLYGVALHYAIMNGNADFALGYTNATGGTTGFGLTPGLGGSGAFFIGLRARH